jgi:hypothetical protein
MTLDILCRFCGVPSMLRANLCAFSCAKWISWLQDDGTLRVQSAFLILLYHIGFTGHFCVWYFFCAILDYCLHFSCLHSVFCKEMWEFGFVIFICICHFYSNYWESWKRCIWNKAIVIYYKLVSQYTPEWLRKTTTICHRCFQSWHFLPRAR